MRRAGIMLMAVTIALTATAMATAKPKHKPRVQVTGWADHEAERGNVRDGGVIRLCNPSTARLYVHFDYRNMKRSAATKISWSVNGSSYASTQQAWSLGKRGTAVATLDRSPNQTSFPLGSYRFELVHAGKKRASSMIQVSACA